MKNWIEGFLEYVKDTESPKIFSEWTAYSVLAASMERRVYITRGHHTIYANLYIILVGKSGARKSSAPKICLDDIIYPTKEFNTINIIKATAEALYEELSNKTRLDNCVYIFADELETFLGDSGFKGDVIPALTRLYDSADEIDYRTRGGGTKVLTNVNINFLACTIFHYIGIMLPKEAITGGFAARVIWVSAERSKKRYAWGTELVDYKLRDLLRINIIRIKNLMGRITVSKKAHFFYKDWYDKYNPKYDPIMEPYYDRKGTTVLKIAMIVAVAETQVNTIEKFLIETHHIEEAIRILSKVEKTMNSIYNSSMGDLSKNCERILDEIKKRGGVEVGHSKAANSLFRYIKTSIEFKEAIEYLIDLGRIKRGLSKHGGKVYSLIEKKEKK